MRERKYTFFERKPGDPPPVTAVVERRVRFHELDPMCVVWHGRYPEYFEEGQTAAAAKCHFSFPELRAAGIMTPIHTLHVEYLAPLRFDERFFITASLLWAESARINMEYLIRKEDGTPVTFAYSIQLFVDGRTLEPLWFAPELWEQCRARWKAGDFHDAE